MKILEIFFKPALLDDPWMSLATSLGILLVTWAPAWFLWCVIFFRIHSVPSIFPEDPDIAYYVGHLLALFTTVVASYIFLRDYFGFASYVLGVAPPLLWILFKIIKVNAARRQGGAAPEAAAAAAGR